MRKWTDEDEARLGREICISLVGMAIFMVVMAALAVEATFF